MATSMSQLFDARDNDHAIHVEDREKMMMGSSRNDMCGCEKPAYRPMTMTT